VEICSVEGKYKDAFSNVQELTVEPRSLLQPEKCRQFSNNVLLLYAVVLGPGLTQLLPGIWTIYVADTQMTCRNFQVFRVLGSTLKVKAQVDSSSRGQKYFICRKEKRKAAWGHAWGLRNPWSHGSGWKLGFYSLFLYCPRVEMSLRSPGKEKYLLGQLSPFRTSCSLSFKSSLSVIALTAVRDRDNKVYSVTTSC
jgi:hypothetical protein